MKLALYTAVLSVLCGAVALLAPAAFDALILVYVPAVVVPACWRRLSGGPHHHHARRS